MFGGGEGCWGWMGGVCGGVRAGVRGRGSGDGGVVVWG